MTGTAVVPAITVPAVTLADGTQITASMTPLERHNAIAKAAGFETLSRPPGIVFGPQGMTPDTQRRMAKGDLEASIDRKTVDALGKAYSTLAPKDRETHRAAYEADLRALYSGQKSPGHFKAALDKAERDARVQTDLNKALAEGKSVDELRQVLDNALGTAVPRDTAGRFKATEPTVQQWVDAHKSVADAAGWIRVESINPAALSGYTLPKLVEKQIYSPEVFQQLADARAAGVTQEQVNAFITEGMRRGGWIQ